MKSSTAHQIHEQLHINLRVAPFSKRFLGYCVDMGILMGSFYVLIFILILMGVGTFFASLKFIEGDPSGATKVGFVLLIMISLFLLLLMGGFHGYFIYFEKKWGTTPGKKLFGLRVANLRPGPLTLKQVVIRDLLRYVDCMMILPGLISVFSTSRKQRLGDLAADTLVVHSATREEANQYVYVSRDEFQSMKAAHPISREVAELDRKAYLKLAFPIFGKKSEALTDTSRMQMLKIMTLYVPEVSSEDSNKVETYLRYFAEHCFQQNRNSS